MTHCVLDVTRGKKGNGEATSALSVVETSDFNQFTHVRLKFKPASDRAAKRSWLDYCSALENESANSRDLRVCTRNLGRWWSAQEPSRWTRALSSPRRRRRGNGKFWMNSSVKRRDTRMKSAE